MHIGKSIKKKRIELNFTQEELSGLVGVDVRTIRRIENNPKPTKISKTYSRIFNKLGISTSDIQLIISMISFDTDMNHLNPNEMLVKLSSKGPQDILSKLEENLVKAYEFAKKGSYHDALDIYLAFAKIYPSEFVFFGCASIYEMIGEYEKAIEYSDKILLMKTYQYEAFYIKGTSLGWLNHYDEGIVILENALQVNKTYQIHYNLGVINWYKENNANALYHYKECLELNPDFAPAHLNLGIYYFESNCQEDSLHHIEEAIRLEPDMYQAYGRKGEYYRYVEQHDKAITNFEECLRLNQENFQALFGIAFSFALKKELYLSSIYFKKLFESYLDTFFKKGIGYKSMLIDFGYKKTRVIELNYVHQDLIEVYINGVCIPVNINKGKSFIFIGSHSLSDKTGSILYPMVGKFFHEECEFKEVTTQIQKSVEFLRWFEHPLYVDINKDIDITITERENNVFIEIIFGETYHIVGVTDTKSGGFQSFVEQYEKYKEMRVHLECPTEKFEICGIENVSFHLLTK